MSLPALSERWVVCSVPQSHTARDIGLVLIARTPATTPNNEPTTAKNPPPANRLKIENSRIMTPQVENCGAGKLSMSAPTSTNIPETIRTTTVISATAGPKPKPVDRTRLVTILLKPTVVPRVETTPMETDFARPASRINAPPIIERTWAEPLCWEDKGYPPLL